MASTLKETKQNDGRDELATVSSVVNGEMFAPQSQETAQQYNMRLLGDTLKTIGMGKYQWHLFLTCGFGFVVDQMLLIAVGLVMPQISKEFKVNNSNYVVIALYCGLLVGALSCGWLIDAFGRRTVWIVSLFLISAWTMICAAAPNFYALCAFVAIQAFCGGGNLAIDLTIFTEFLPKKNAYLLTTLASMWGVGSALGGLIAWPLIANFSCPDDATPDTCPASENRGWRYQYITIGGLCLVMAVIRGFILKLEESPGWLVSQGRYDEAASSMAEVARVNRSSVNTDLVWRRHDNHDNEPDPEGRRLSPPAHIKGLFAGTKLIRSTISVFILWMGIGIAYPIYTLFLPTYLAANGADLGDGSIFATYRDYTISSVVGIFGPILSGYLVQIPILGRRRSMTITACCAGAFALAFTTVRTESQNLAFSSMISFWQNAYYGILYAYTPEVMPVSHRGTGCGIALAAGRLASISSPIISTYTGTGTSTPIWVCCGLYFAMAIICLTMPFEPGHYDHDQVDQELKV